MTAWFSEVGMGSRISFCFSREVRQRNCALMGAVTLSGHGVSLPVLGGLRQSPLWQLGDPGHDFSCAFDTQEFCD